MTISEIVQIITAIATLIGALVAVGALSKIREERQKLVSEAKLAESKADKEQSEARRIDVEAARSLINELQEERKCLAEERAKERQARNQLIGHATALERKVGESREQIDVLRKERHRLTGYASKLERRIDQADEKIGALREQVTFLLDENKRKEARIEELKRNNEINAARIAELETANAELKTLVSSLRSRIRELEARNAELRKVNDELCAWAAAKGLEPPLSG